jgi:hypothetical protein
VDIGTSKLTIGSDFLLAKSISMGWKGSGVLLGTFYYASWRLEGKISSFIDEN